MSKTAKALRKLALMRAREREGTFQARAQRREQEEALEKAIEQQNKKAMKEEELFEERSHGERRYIPATDRISTAEARGRLHSLAEQFLKSAEAGKETDANNFLAQMPKGYGLVEIYENWNDLTNGAFGLRIMGGKSSCGSPFGLQR